MIAYGDYNASSNKYKDSTNTWSLLKAKEDDNIIVQTEDVLTVGYSDIIKVPLRISRKIDEFSAMGLELKYPKEDYKLVYAAMPGTKDKNGATTINPTLDEIITDNNDLLVTDHEGTIRVVYATTNYFDVNENDEMIILGFAPNKELLPGEIDFSLAGTGVIGNQYGEEMDDAYLLMPKVFVQGTNNNLAGFDVSIYPNPVNRIMNVCISVAGSEKIELSIFNIYGQIVLEETLSGSSGIVLKQLDMDKFTSGVYSLKVVCGEKEFIGRVVVDKQ